MRLVLILLFSLLFTFLACKTNHYKDYQRKLASVDQEETLSVDEANLPEFIKTFGLIVKRHRQSITNLGDPRQFKWSYTAISKIPLC